MLRRSPEAVLVTHEFDPRRRELYVEGPGDAIFFRWLTEATRNQDSLIIAIELVDMPLTRHGGNRQRLLDFLSAVEDKAPRIRGFVDKDQDHILCAMEHPSNSILTDFRDRESYVLWTANIAKVLSLGAHTDKVTPEDFLASTFSAALLLAAARLVSIRQDLKLPVSDTGWEKKLKTKDGLVVSVDRSGILRMLLQNAGLSLQMLANLEKDVSAAEQELMVWEPQQVMHGKDSMKIIAKQFQSLNVVCEDAFHLLGPTFNRTEGENQRNLASAIAFVEGK
ncbi:DUF4435 domain-containing protein [Paenarthrobacter ureafaciens]|uniref:DUF4435 domain-containing protein n=1 Tax=Paenarthrobacter ureafaciens TaxID=37931 RepID=UPI0019177DE3|nr:DUF4435 domain-containing protein [Paenarthrobacter ureafaciens]QQQ61891.1 DUF4435 domain-containing protein [Paenarthrobacter ureafaciens]